MKRIGFLFEKLISRENLSLAIKNASKGKSTYKIVQKMAEKPDKYIEILYDLLSNNKYKHADYVIKYIHDKGKLREIKKTAFFPDRVIHHAVIQVINPILNKHFIAHTYQSIIGKGVHKAVDYAYKSVRKQDAKYALLLDITKFYPSVNNDYLMSLFRRIIKDKKMLNIIAEIVYSTEGLPIGNFTSQPFGNFSISDIDHYAKEKLGLKYYVRYADDILILGESKEYLHKVRAILTKMLTDRGLKVKPNYQVFDITIRSPDYLGYILTQEGKRLRKSTKRRFIRLMQRNVWNKRTISALVSYLGWLGHANTKRLIATYFTNEVKQAIRQYGVHHSIPSIILKEIG